VPIGDSLRDSLGAFRSAFRDEYAALRADGGGAAGGDVLGAYAQGRAGADTLDAYGASRTAAYDPLAAYGQARAGATGGTDWLGGFGGYGGFGGAAARPEADAFTLHAGARAKSAFDQAEIAKAEAAQVRAQGMTGYQGGDPETDPYRADIDAAAKEFGVDGDTLAAIMAVESHGKADARSPAGAAGLMQVMPMHFQAGEDPFDPRTNIRAGARVLAGYVKQYNGDLDTAIRAYHGFGSDQFTNDTQYLGLVKQRRLQIQNARAQAPQASGGGVGPVPSFTGDYQLHWGEDPGATDIMMPEGTPVVSIGAGTVVDSSFNSVGGNSVTIRLDNGLTVYMAHFRDPSPLRAGQRVAPGSFVGYVGQTGNAAGTGTHLHIGIGPTILSGTGPRGGAGAYANGQPFDAVGYLRGLRRGAVQPQQRGRPS
jgi:murein DD-endopeptidase MepM/ murein hydrolase activator NlpD